MYSLVLVAALSSGADVDSPSVGVPVVMSVGVGCTGAPGGCNGCAGYGVSYGCSGSGYGSSSYGSSCYGSMFGHGSGSGIFGLRSGNWGFGHRFQCHGGSTVNYSCYGGGGSCYGCGGSGYPGNGCIGSSWGPAVGMPPYTLHGYGSGCAGAGCGGGCSGINYSSPSAVYGTVTNVAPVVIHPADTTPVVEPKPVVDPKPMTDPKKPMGANLKFKVPADARIFVDGRLTVLTGTERSFTTPPLAVGQKFYYDVKAEMTVNGTAVTEEKRLVVEAGADLTESFSKLFAAVENKGNPVAGK